MIRVPSGWGGADQHDNQGGGLVEWVAPGVAGPVLDHGVPRTELNRRAIVQFEDDSAGQVVFEVDRDVVCMPGSSGSL